MKVIIAVLIIVVVVIGCAFATDKLLSFIENSTDNKRKKAHPQLWTWFKECDDAGQEECRWYNAQIAPLKNKVDAILREWDYYSTETRVQKEEELENLRKAIESANVVYREMCNKTKAIRSKIHDYVEEHDLEWAKSWGW